jgi:hypothetical protein
MPTVVIALTVSSFRTLPCLDAAQPQVGPLVAAPVSFAASVPHSVRRCQDHSQRRWRNEEVVEVEAHVQAEEAFFDVDMSPSSMVTSLR